MRQILLYFVFIFRPIGHSYGRALAPHNQTLWVRRTRFAASYVSVPSLLF